MERLFVNGAYQGHGRWVDQKSEGDYTVEYLIAGGGKRPRVHTVKRVFRQPGGAVAYEENTTLTLEPAARNRMQVTITGEQGSVSGHGYWFEKQAHYELDVSTDNRLEFTFTVAAIRIDGMGSATNKGNFTSWRESLTRVG
jgi:hypothetical protein